MKATALASYGMLSSVLADVRLLRISPESKQLTNTCIAVLNQAVHCDQSLEYAGRGRIEDEQTLKRLCTSTCLDSLTTWLRRAYGACKPASQNATGHQLLPASLVEDILENYNLLCLQDK